MNEVQDNMEVLISFGQEDQYLDLSFDYVPSVYIVQEGWTVAEPERELSDKEILRSLEQDGHFDFLKDPEEDIYGLNDGEAL